MKLLRALLSLFRSTPKPDKSYLNDPHWWENADDSDVTREMF